MIEGLPGATERTPGLRPRGVPAANREFAPALAGPIDANYVLGPGDLLVLVLTGDVERSQSFEVNREGFILIPQVGQVQVANLTLGQATELLYSRLGRVYSGIGRGPDARTRFQLSVGKIRAMQIYVSGDVARPGLYQVSGAGSVLSALYSAGGPTARGSFRKIEVRRGSELLGTVDLYDYLLRGHQQHQPAAHLGRRGVRPSAWPPGEDHRGDPAPCHL